MGGGKPLMFKAYISQRFASQAASFCMNIRNYSAFLNPEGVTSWKIILSADYADEYRLKTIQV